MSTQAMINVRLDKGLKAEGDSVLARTGISTTEAIRSLYRYMEKNHEVPPCCINDSETTTNDTRRAMMRDLIGIALLEPEKDATTIRAERHSHLKL